MEHTYLTLDRRLSLLLHLLLLLLLKSIKTKTGHTGNSTSLIFLTEKKIIGENYVLKVVVVSYTGYLVELEYPARRPGNVGHARYRTPNEAVQRVGRQYEPGSVGIARRYYLLLRACDWNTINS